MNPKKPIFRMDLLSRKSCPKQELIRLVFTDGKLVYDRNGNLPCKGIYIHKDSQTIEKVFQKGILKRYTKDKELLLALERELKDAD